MESRSNNLCDKWIIIIHLGCINSYPKDNIWSYHNKLCSSWLYIWRLIDKNTEQQNWDIVGIIRAVCTMTFHVDGKNT